MSALPASLGDRPGRTVVGVALALTLPFLGKASTLDEETHLFIARYLRDALAGGGPLRVFDWVRPFQPFHNPAPGDYFLHPHPPGWHLALAAWTAVAGEGPSVLARLPGPALLALTGCATLALARRVGARPLPAALLVVTSPVAVLAAHATFMPDLPLMALLAAAAWAAAEGGARRSLPWLAAGGALAGLAALVKYPALLAWPGLAALAWACASAASPGDAGEAEAPRGPAPRPAAVVAAFCAPAVLAFSAFQAYTLAAYGEVHALHVLLASDPIARSPWTHRAAATLTALGAVALAPGVGPWWGLRAPGPGRAQVAAASVAAAALLLAATGVAAGGEALRGASRYGPFELAAVVVLLAAGAATLLGALRQARDARSLALGVWLAGMVAAQVAGLSFASARYLAPVLPALALLLTRSEPRRARPWPALVAAQAALAALLAVADHQFAGTAPWAARVVDRAWPEEPGRARWVCAEWGLRDALAARGFRPVPPDRLPGSGTAPVPGPRPGDVLVRAEVAPADPACDRVPTRGVDKAAFRSDLPLRLMSRAAHAGYYGDHWGLLPFALSAGPLETVWVHEVQAEAPSVPAASAP